MAEVTSQEIKEALSKKHWDEFFMTEVKTGASMYSWKQIDALAIYKSWTHQRIVAYEIKTSRSDFLRDNKMNTYLEYCHELYLICPQGLILPTELPVEFGLMYYNPKTKKIVTRRKALFRRIPVNADLLYYLIMYRLQSDRYPFHSSKAEYFRDWLANKEDGKRLGKEVAEKLGKEIRRLNEELDKTRYVREQSALLQQIKDVLKSHGINPWTSSEIPEAINKALSRSCPVDLDLAVIQLEAALKTIKTANERSKINGSEQQNDQPASQ